MGSFKFPPLAERASGKQAKLARLCGQDVRSDPEAARSAAVRPRCDAGSRRNDEFGSHLKSRSRFRARQIGLGKIRREVKPCRRWCPPQEVRKQREYWGPPQLMRNRKRDAAAIRLRFRRMSNSRQRYRWAVFLMSRYRPGSSMPSPSQSPTTGESLASPNVKARSRASSTPSWFVSMCQRPSR